MTGQLALLGVLALILWLFSRERGRRNGVSGASWIVLAWLLLFASRPLSSLFQSGGTPATPDGYLDGSPIDRAAFSTLIIVGILILVRRGRQAFAGLRQNVWALVFFGYCAASILWSDYPFV